MDANVTSENARHKGVRTFIRTKLHLNAVEHIRLRRLCNCVQSCFNLDHAPTSPDHDSNEPPTTSTQPQCANEQRTQTPRKTRLLRSLKKFWQKVARKHKHKQPQNEDGPQDTQEPETVAIANEPQIQIPDFLPVTEPVQIPGFPSPSPQVRRRPESSQPRNTNTHAAPKETTTTMTTLETNPPANDAPKQPTITLTPLPTHNTQRSTLASLISYFQKSTTRSELDRCLAEHKRLCIISEGKPRVRGGIPREWMSAEGRCGEARACPRVVPVATVPVARGRVGRGGKFGT